MLVAAIVLVSATYAWFTASDRVTSSSVTARSGSDTAELQISAAGGEDFLAVEAAPITQVGGAAPDALLPVTTADLQTFLTATVTGPEAVYRPVEEGASLYHGRVYLRYAAQGTAPGSMDLYLDENALAALSAVGDSDLLNAARLGLVFDGADRVILSLSETGNAAADQVRNTWLNGAQVPDGSVLTTVNGAVTAVDDPSVPITDYMLSTAGGFSLPERPLCRLEPGAVCPVDVYFYLEGCDPDCSDAISFDAADLALSFYGVLSS